MINSIRPPAASSGQKRSYKKKKKSSNKRQHQYSRQEAAMASGMSSDDDMPLLGPLSDIPELDEADDGPFAFRRKRNCQYLAPLLDEHGFEVHRGWPWESPDDGGAAEPKYRYENSCGLLELHSLEKNRICRYSLASLSTPKAKCIGMTRRRMGRGGRVVLDRAKTQVRRTL